MTKISINAAVGWLARNRGLVRPYGKTTYLRDMTETEWDSFQWNPPDGYDNADPNASPKPSWSALVDASRRNVLEGFHYNVEQTLEYGPSGESFNSAENVRNGLTHLSSLNVGGESVHTGPLSHMSGLIKMVEGANESGKRLPHVVMRDDNHRRISFHTNSGLRAVLDAATERENIVESAHNVVMDQIHDAIRTAKDESVSLDNRELAATKAQALADSYKTHLEAEIAAYDPDALPDDLDELKEVYIEWLEAYAMGRVKFLRGVRSQQGIDLPDTCDDEANALRKVAELSRRGSFRIQDAADAAKAKAAYDNAVDRIDKVWPLNTPVWTLNGTSLGRNPDPQELQALKFKATVDHPSGLDETDPVTVGGVGGIVITDLDGTDYKGDFTKRSVTTSGTAVTFDFEFPTPVIVTFTARNLCGPTVLKVALEGASS